jgi:hypothetical protein
MTTIIDNTNDPYASHIPSNLSSFIIAKNSLLDDVLKSKTIEMIVKELSNIPEFAKYKSDLEFIKLTGNLIENAIPKSKPLDFKIQILIDIFIKLFGNISDNEKNAIRNTYNFLINNKKIKKIKISKKVIKMSYKFVKSLFANKKN